MFCNLPPQKPKTTMQSTISCQLLMPYSRWQVALHVENLRESGEATIGGLTSRCRSHPPKTRTVTRIVAPTSSIPVTVVVDSPGRGPRKGSPKQGGCGGVAARDPRPYMYICTSIRICTFICIYVPICVYMYICIYYIYILLYGMYTCTLLRVLSGVVRRLIKLHNWKGRASL